MVDEDVDEDEDTVQMNLLRERNLNQNLRILVKDSSYHVGIYPSRKRKTNGETSWEREMNRYSIDRKN